MRSARDSIKAYYAAIVVEIPLSIYVRYICPL